MTKLLNYPIAIAFLFMSACASTSSKSTLSLNCSDDSLSLNSRSKACQGVLNMAKASEEKAAVLAQSAETSRLLGDYDSAFSALEQAESLKITPSDIAVAKAQIRFSQGDEKGADVMLQQALRIDPSNISAMYISARDARHGCSSRNCVSWLDEALAFAPNNASLLALRALCHAETGNVKESNEDLIAAQHAGIKSSYGYNDLALAYITLEKFDKAAAASRKALAIDPVLEDAHFDLITALMAAGEHKAALTAFEQFKSTGASDTIGVANNIAWELYLAGLFKEAQSIISEWLENNPKPNSTPNNIGNMDGYPKVLDTAAHIEVALGNKVEAGNFFSRAASMGGSKLSEVYKNKLIEKGFSTKENFDLDDAIQRCTSNGADCKLLTPVNRTKSCEL